MPRPRVAPGLLRALSIAALVLVGCLPGGFGQGAEGEEEAASCGIFPDNAGLVPSGCDSTCRQETLDALRGLYAAWNGERLWDFENGSGSTGRGEEEGGDGGGADRPHKGNWSETACAPCSGHMAYGPSAFAGSDGMEPLPSYCCWEGVYCCREANRFMQPAEAAADAAACDPYSVRVLQLRSANISGPFQDGLPHLATLHRRGLTHLDLSRNFITGTLPEELGNLTRLNVLLLGSNNITGTVPPSLGRLTQLAQLDLEFNFLGGQLRGGQLCGRRGEGRLAALYLRANNFTGPLDLRNCTELTIMDIQENGFSGTLPISSDNRRLAVVRARLNDFSGELPSDVFGLPQLMTFDVTNNSLRGQLPPSVSSSNFLSSLFLGSNNLSGTIPAGVAQSGQLSILDLSDNPWLTGTLPDMTWMLGLQSLSISNTRVSGTIPAELAGLPYLQTVDMHNTLMTCCASEDEAKRRQGARELLPPFLEFNERVRRPPSEELLGQDAEFNRMMNTGRNMLCPTVGRSPDFQFVTERTVSRPADLSRQQWNVDPEYYWFLKCSCNSGFDTGRDSSFELQMWCGSPSSPSCVNMTVLTCTARPKMRGQEIAAVILGGLVMLGLLLLLLVVINSLFARAGKVRRVINWWHKHLAGMPRSGRMSLVVTDIEGYSDLFKRCPELMYRALTLHNNVVRRAKYEHNGSTVQQEGDSYTLAFHDAFDAVAFCLQAQLALMEVAWPEGLMGDDSVHVAEAPGSARGGKGGRRLKLVQLEGMSSLLGGRSGGWLRKQRGSAALKASASSGAMVVRGSSSALTVPSGLPRDPHSAAVAGDLPPCGGPGASPSAVSLGALPPARSRSRMLFRGGASASGGWLGGAPGGAAAFHGLRVRMGVVTGVVEAAGGADSAGGSPPPAGSAAAAAAAASSSSKPQAAIMNSSLYKLALDVSDAGNGGQVLMDGATFARIKEDLHPLGAVDSAGINFAKLSQQTSLWRALCLQSVFHGRRHEARFDDEAVLLDMGEYELPAPRPRFGALARGGGGPGGAGGGGNMLRLSIKYVSRSLAPGAIGGGAGGGAGGGGGGHKRSATLDLGAYGGADAAGEATSSLPGGMPLDPFAPDGGLGGGGGGGGASGRERLRLVQILSPQLVGRAHAWGNKLALRESWVCTDAPYFEAPGTLEAPLGGSSIVRTASTGSLGPSSVAAPPTPLLASQSSLTPSPSLTDGSLDEGAPPRGPSVPRSASDSAAAAMLRESAAAAAAAAGDDVESQLLRGQRLKSASMGGSVDAPRPAPLPLLAPAAPPPPLLLPPAPIPPVTMVFLVVEGAKAFGKGRRSLVKEVHCTLSLLLIEALRHVPGGYLCRMQEGDLKYMVAFASARGALEWCLLVQEAAMYLSWPDERWHRTPQLRSEYDASGALVFRGPRIKMGVCEGVPRTIIPDHLGRADYHGASVNQAARYMDAGAHGGQIACEAELAAAVLAQWAADAAARDSAADVPAADTAGRRSFEGPSRPSSPPPALETWAEADPSLGDVPGHEQQQRRRQRVESHPLMATDPLRDTAEHSPFFSSAPPAPATAGSAAADELPPLDLSSGALEAASSADSASWPGGPRGANANGSPSGLLHRLLHKGGGGGGGAPRGLASASTDLAAEAAAAALRSPLRLQPPQPQQQQQQQRVFGLQDVPTTPVHVQVHHLGSFRFKGNPQPLDMVNVMAAPLAGRQALFPDDPPKGKGGRVAARSGLVGAGVAPLPTLAAQYRARVPLHVLEHPAGGAGAAQLGRGLRIRSMPVQRSGGALGSGGGGSGSGLGAGLGDGDGRAPSGGAHSFLSRQRPQLAAVAEHHGAGRPGLSLDRAGSGGHRRAMGRSQSAVTRSSSATSADGAEPANGDVVIPLAVLRGGGANGSGVGGVAKHLLAEDDAHGQDTAGARLP